MRRPLSLTLRLSLLFGIAAAVVFFAFGWIIMRSIEHHFETEDVRELQAMAQAVQQALAATRPERDLAFLERRFEDILVGHQGASLYVAGEDGQTVFTSLGPDLAALVHGSAEGADDGPVRRWYDGIHTYRALIGRMDQDSVGNGRYYSVAVAVPIDHHLRFLDDFRRVLWLMIASSIAIMGILGWIAVRQGHAPLRSVVARIRRISANELTTRLAPEEVPVELRDLAASFNEMLERMEEAFLRLSNFSADIAHELRTPVTNLMTQTQVALSHARTVDEYREILYSNMEEYEHMAQMIGDMLFLAQADNGLCRPNVSRVNLAEEVQALFDYYEAWAEEHGVTLAMEGNAQVTGDRLMLRRALSNLLSNAIRHTPAGETVQVQLESSDSGATSIVIENPGPDIPPEHIERLFDRFYRIDPSRRRSEDGAGLGLAIVKSIVEAHHGKITVNSAERRTRFQVMLPGAIS